MEAFMKGQRLMINTPADLTIHLDRETDPKVRLKLAFLQCMAHLTIDLETLCQAFGIATSTGYWWIRNWNQRGYQGLQENPQGPTGRPPRLDDADIIHLASLLKEKTDWTTAEIQALIQTTFGIEYSCAQVIRIVRKRLKMHFGKPFPHDYRRPDNAEQILKERLEEVFKTLKEKGLRQDDIALGFVDETSPQNCANTVRVWSFESSPVTIRNSTHFKTNTIGFYAIKGHSHQAFLETSNQESIRDFLEQIKTANAEYKAIVIVLDNYMSHKATQVKHTAEALEIYLVYLPAYSPDLNPEEYLWKSLKRELSRGLIQTVDEMKTIVETAWNDLSESLGFAKYWIETFLSKDSIYSELCK
jgi:transposase